MAAIRNATELLGRLDPPTPQLLRLKSIFDRQTAQTAKLIDGLLDVARVARGKVEVRRVPLEFVELVRQAVGDRSKQFEGRQLRLLLPQAELWVEADRVRLIQILDNLISNALRFTPLQGCISIELTSAGARGCLRIEDDGDGIESELLPYIFEPFRQGRSTSQGLGLGLALVKGLCDLHGFSLTAQSSGTGRGACFQIEFPLAAVPDSSPPESRVDGRRLDLLLVEDNEDVAETLAELLRVEGHRVERVGNAELGLQVLRERRPDVVLSDIGLPGMDGLALARSVRDDPTLSNIKLVALTGFGDAATESRIKAAGFERCLIKPVQLDALRSCLARMAVR
jgi:two-component system CheB/CheR fusion protein